MLRCARHATGVKVPWYSMNPRHIRVHRVLLGLLVCMALLSVNEKHVWQWAWSRGYHAWYNLRPVSAIDGRRHEAWRWVEGKEIRIYTSAAIADVHVTYAAHEVAALIDDVGLNMRVRVLAPPPRVREALRRSTTGTGESRYIDFDRLCAEMVATRPGAYAEVVYAPGVIDNDPEVVGAAVFSHGVGVLRAERASAHTARHEVAHLLGYHLHDTWPLAVIGYSTPWLAKYQRDAQTNDWLMMPRTDGANLSDRAQDALVHFWRGLEARTGERFFVGGEERRAGPQTRAGSVTGWEAPSDLTFAGSFVNSAIRCAGSSNRCPR